MRLHLMVLSAGLISAASLQAANVTFTVNYTDSAGEGFNDPTLGASRKSAFQYALNIWGSYLTTSYTNETVRVDAAFDPMGGTASSATLGSAGSQRIWGLEHPLGQTLYGDALANHLYGDDLSDERVGPNTAEIRARFNSDVDGGTVLGATNWYYGTNAAPGGNIDFVTVVLHEVGHGLNFFDTVNSTTGGWLYSNTPGIYDRFLYDGVTGKRLDDATMTNPQRLAAITSGQLFWDGADGKAANGGIRPEIYAPSPYEPGSSVAHLDEATYGAELMSPYYSGADHLPSAMELGMLKDMGWDVVVPEPSIAGMGLMTAVVALGRRSRKKAAA